jgi:hypothetical protein
MGGDEVNVYELYKCSSDSNDKGIMISVQVNGADLDMELDTGASVSVMGSDTFNALWSQDRPTIHHTTAQLRTYTNETIETMGTVEVTVLYNGQRKVLPIVVTAGAGPTLFGRNWLHELRVDWKKIHHLVSNGDGVLNRHKDVFNPTLGLLTDVPATFHVDPSAVPTFHKARPIPYAMRDQVIAELERLEDEGIIEKIPHSQWAAPIVPVMKSNGNIRICGDFRSTINVATKTETYPIPKIEDLYATLTGGKKFTKLDLSNAYLQVSIDEEYRKYTTINTMKGLYQYTRLPFGVSSAPAIFQRIMENVLKDIPGVCVYLDVILITGRNDAEHQQTLDTVLTRINERGLKLNREKCEFMLSSGTYLGHMIDSDGLHPLSDKVDAVANAPVPTNVSELKSYLGLVNFYGRFLKQPYSLH